MQSFIGILSEDFFPLWNTIGLLGQNMLNCGGFVPEDIRREGGLRMVSVFKSKKNVAGLLLGLEGQCLQSRAHFIV